MAAPFAQKPPTPATPKPAPFRCSEPQPPAASPQLTPTLANAVRAAVLWSLLGLGLAGGGVGFVWLVTSPDDIDQKILTLTGRGRP